MKTILSTHTKRNGEPDFDVTVIRVALAVLLSAFVSMADTQRLSGQAQTREIPRDQTVTQLPNGLWLILGGQTSDGPVRTAAIVDRATGETRILTNGLSRARFGHTATVLPNGKVMILGGLDGRGIVPSGEIFDP